MPPTLKDFMKTVRLVPKETHDLNTELLKVAAVKAVELTGHPAWDKFLQQLQAKLDEAEGEVVMWVERCVTAHTTDDMRYAQRQVTHYQAQRDLLRQIMALPMAVIEEQQGQGV